MKKIIIIISLVFTAVSVSAQQYWDGSRPDHRFTFGLRAGANLSKVFDDEMEWRYNWGYQVGAVAELNLVRSLSLGTGLYYIQKGFKMELEYSPTFTQTFDYSPKYLEIPLLLRNSIVCSPFSNLLEIIERSCSLMIDLFPFSCSSLMSIISTSGTSPFSLLVNL